MQITYLPYPITAPGTYVLASDLTFTNPNPATTGVTAITVATNLSGPVIIDLKGHTLTGPGTVSVGVGIGFYAGTATTTNLGMTVRNGTIKNFTRGVNAIVGGVYLSNINVNHVSFFTAVISGSNDNAGVIIDYCNDSSPTAPLTEATLGYRTSLARAAITIPTILSLTFSNV